MARQTNSKSWNPRALIRKSLAFLTLAALSIGCGDWAEYGNGPLNPHNKNFAGPQAGIASILNLLFGTGGGFGQEVGVLVDHNGDYYVSSYSNWIHYFWHTGTWGCAVDLGVPGSRAVPYIATFDRMLFTGAEGGGFYAIEFDKSATPCTLNIVASDLTIGKSESSPKRALDQSLYMAEHRGIVHRFDYAGGGVLTHLGSLALASGEEVTGGIALYDVTPDYEAEEVLVATTAGNFYVLDHELTTVIWSETTGSLTADQYYAGVTVAERGPHHSPVALLPIAARNGATTPNSGILRAIDLALGNVAWELAPSKTLVGKHEIVGSVAVLFEQTDYIPGTPSSTHPGSGTRTPGNPGDNRDGTDAEIGLWHATFASTDTYLYGVDLISGLEIWDYHMRESGFEAPVVDASNLIYVGDGSSLLHAVNGNMFCPGCVVWVNASLQAGNQTDIVKLGLTREYWDGGDRGLVVGTRKEAFALWD